MKRDTGITKFFSQKGSEIFSALRKVERLSWISGITIFFAGGFIILRIADVWTVSLSDTDNARYFLSTVAQALAALFALVITVSLIVMQLLTSTYTSAIFGIYKKRFKIWVSFLVPIFTIIFSLFVLLRLQSRTTCKFECIETDTVLVLTGLSVIWNIIYFFDLLEILKPKNFLQMMNKSLQKRSGKQEILSILGEVCVISMQKRDLFTAKECLVIFEGIFKKLNEKDVASLFDILEHIFTKAIESDSSEMIYAVLETSVYQPLSPIWANLEQS